MYRFTSQGTPFERGRQQGQECGDRALPWFRDRIEAVRQQAAPGMAAREVAAWRRRMERVYPEGHAECCGIAAGMGWSEDDYFAAIASFRILQCQAFCIVAGFVTAGGQPLFAKTDDVLCAELGMNVLETTVPDNGYRHAHFHFAGSIWTVAGMNERGLALGMTGIPGPAIEDDGLLSLDALHTVLPSCATVDEALAHIRALPLNGYGFSLTLADASGRFAQVEKSGAGFVLLPLPPGGAYLHGNRILDPPFAARNPLQAEGIGANSDRRLRNAARLLATLPRTEEGLLALVNDRAPDGAIWQTGSDGLYTDFGAMFLPAVRQIRFCIGQPDPVEQPVVNLGEIFNAE